MGVDITIKERDEFRCPDCGRLVIEQDICEEWSSGRVWYDFLESIGYYVPYEKRTDENDWYGKDMVLTDRGVSVEKRFTEFFIGGMKAISDMEISTKMRKELVQLVIEQIQQPAEEDITK